MKKKRRFLYKNIILWVLVLACFVMAGMIAWLRPFWLVYVAGFFVAALILTLIMVRKLRRAVRKTLQGDSVEQAGRTSGLAALSIPVVALSDDAIQWCNAAFTREIADDNEAVTLPLESFVPGIEPRTTAMPGGQNVEVNGRRYTAHGSVMDTDPRLFFILFNEDTVLKNTADEYAASRPSVVFFLIDTYDEVLKKMRETDRGRITSAIDTALEEYVGGTTGFLRKVSTSRYIAVVEERHMQTLIADRFSILDTARTMDGDTASVSLSIGVGRGGATLKECEEMALQALDMALGRGGDQAAVRSADGFEFYGGLSRSVEKRTKVKSRIMAAAIKDLLDHCDRVLIMGHKNSDMDSLGAAVGMLRFCKICRKPAAIVINAQKTHAEPLYRLLHKNGYGQDMLTPDQGLLLAGPRTLLIVVDTHMKHLLESEEIYAASDLVVVIDHHRKMVGHIDDAVLFYQEIYASSASELVTELLQYVGDSDRDKLNAVEAEALLAGIMLDTRTFSLHVGVRTFEAAAYLRLMGAQTAEVKKLFASSKDEYLYRTELVSQAEIYNDFAIVISGHVPVDSEVVGPQAANDLLTIDRVLASVVAIKQDETVRISARSMGEVNVQLLMEKLGGGGHLTMAGAQLKNTELEQAEQLLRAAIDEYNEEHEPHKNAPAKPHPREPKD